MSDFETIKFCKQLKILNFAFLPVYAVQFPVDISLLDMAGMHIKCIFRMARSFSLCFISTIEYIIVGETVDNIQSIKCYSSVVSMIQLTEAFN